MTQKYTWLTWFWYVGSSLIEWKCSVLSLEMASKDMLSNLINNKLLRSLLKTLISYITVGIYSKKWYIWPISISITTKYFIFLKIIPWLKQGVFLTALSTLWIVLLSIKYLILILLLKMIFLSPCCILLWQPENLCLSN